MRHLACQLLQTTAAAEWHQICCKISYGLFVLHAALLSGQYRLEEYINFGIIF